MDKKWKELITESILKQTITWVYGGILTFLGLGVWIFFDFLNSEITIITWVLFFPFFIGLLCGVFILFFEKGFIKDRYKKYNQDEFFDVLWIWKWDKYGKVIEHSITPLCPNCLTELIHFDSSNEPESHVICRSREECDLNKFIKIPGKKDSIKEELKHRIEAKVRRREI